MESDESGSGGASDGAVEVAVEVSEGEGCSGATAVVVEGGG